MKKPQIILEEAHKDLCRVAGYLNFTLIKHSLSRNNLLMVAVTLERIAADLRKLAEPKP